MPAVRHTRAALVFCLAVVFATAGCKAGPRPPGPVPPVTVGLLTAVSGPTAALGKEATQGAQLAADLVNGDVVDIPLPLAAGAGLPGLRGARLNLAVADSAGDAGRVSAALDSVSAAAVVAADGAGVVEAAARLADQRRLPTVDALTDAGYLTGLGLDWYFRTAPEERAIDGAALALLANRPGGATLRRLAILLPTTQTGPGTPVRTVSNLSDRAVAAGFTVAGTRIVKPEATAASATADDVEELLPDAVLAVAGTAAEATAVLRVASRVRPVVPVVALGAGFANPASGEDAPETLLRAAGWSADLTTRNPVARAVADLYKRRFGTAMTETAANTFTATMAIATAINGAGAADPASVRAGLHQLWIPATQTIMPWDGIRFVASGQNELAGGVVEQRSGNSPFRVVYPRELAAAPATWPSPRPSR